MSKLEFIRDEEIQNLNGDEDLLETKKYANTLKEVITNSDTPFTIGLFGEWGSGKSSIVNTAQNDLEADSDNKIKFIKYDAWKYANDSFRRMFLKEVQNGLNIEGTSEFEAFYVDKNTTTKIDKKVNVSFLLISLFIIIVAFASVFLMKDNTPIEWKISVPLFIAVIGMSVSIARNFFDSYKVTVQNPKIFAPEQFEDIFDEMVDSALSTTQITKPKKWIQGEFTENKIDKLIIVVDNIDRCDKETAYELLTNIKNFLEREGIIFVVPIDDSALRRHLKEKNNEDSKEADEFLRKFFNVTLKIKHFQSRDLFIFTNDLNKKYELGLQADTIDIIAKEYATNPRRIIQLLNNLISELNIVEQKYESDFVEENESLIALLLIIREEWSCVYKIISDKSHMLQKYSEIVFDENSTIKNDVIHFLTRTKAIFENVDIQIIENLISNIDNDLKVSSEILEYIKNNEYKEVEEYIEDDDKYNELIYYFIEEFNKELTRGTFKLGALNRFKNILKLNEMKEISRDINNKLYRDVSNEEILKIIENLSEDDLDSFYKFVDLNQRQGLSYLENLILKEYKEVWKDKLDDGNEDIKEKPKVWTDGLENFINNSSNTIAIEKLQDIFVNYYDYFSESPIYDKKWINEDKLQYIVSKDLIDYLIDKMNPALDNDSFKELSYLTTLQVVSIDDIQNLFTSLIENTEERFEEDDQNEIQKLYIERLRLKLQKLYQLVSKATSSKNKLKSDSIDKYIKSLNQTVTLSYPHPHPQHRQNQQNNQKMSVNFLNDISDDKDLQELLLKFYFEIYRVTNNYTNVTQYMINIVNKYESLKELFFKLLVDLRDNNGYHLQSLFSYLIELDDISSNLFNLYKKLFIQDKYINSDEVRDKTKALIQTYITEENETIEFFLVEMLQDTSIKSVITEIVTDLPTEEIVLLPKEIQQLTYDYLCDNDKLFDIEDKIDFIKAVLNFGSQYKNCIVKIIVSKLQNKAKVKGALEILDDLKYPSAENKSELCSALKKYEKDEEYVKDVKKYIKKYCS